MAEDLDDDQYVDADLEGGGSGNEDGDEFETILDMRPKDVWSSAGAKKNEVVRELIKCFGSMVESHAKEYAIQDMKGRYKAEDLVYEKLLDAPRYVAKAKRALILNENFDTREFSLFIASKGWAKSILRPLLELCAKDDSILAMRCCSLALVLIRRLSESSQKVLAEATRGAKRKASSLDLQQNEDDKEEDEKQQQAEKASAVSKEKEQAALMSRIANVKLQVAALLSFKDALCSDKCNEAIANAFKEFWLKEQVESSEDNKTGVAICFSYLRRILAIEAHPQWSSAGEIQHNRLVHDRYIVQLRLLLSVLPGVCSDLLRSYHNDWLGDVILIIYFTLRGFEPKDLHRVWRTGALIEDFENLDSYDAVIDTDTPAAAVPALAAAPVVAPKKAIDVIIPTSLAQANRQSAANAGKGQLSQLLSKERNARAAAMAPLGTTSRFRGVYQRTVAHAAPLPTLSSVGAAAAASNTNSELDHILGPAAPTTSAPGNPFQRRDATATTSSTTAPAPAAESAEETVKCHPQMAKILRNPFAPTGATIPQAQAKRNKKNLTFALDTTLAEVQASSSYLTSDDHQKAAVVAATLANLLSSELSLKPLVKRVNEDLRRDDMRVGQELELRYFDILYRVLHYNRLKLADDYRAYQNNLAASGQAPAERPWEPNLKNVMDALDRMSFTRVVTAIERVGKNLARAEDVVVPLSLFKEMVCYLRVLLESGLEGHHEIAIAALHRLYYASSERLDPLPKLLSAWKLGTYPRRHLHMLVELVHETLKTLEAAQVRFRPEGDRNAEAWARQKYKRKGKNEMDLEQYVMACMRFLPDDYFKKLVTNQTVRMYTKLLSHYKQNDSSINYYAYCFLRRMNAFTLEQENPTPKPPAAAPGTAPSTADSAAGAGDEVSLGFMLFNFHTLEVFERIVNDRDCYANPAMEPLLRLVKAIVRRFGEAADKNHMLYVELLFQHQRPHEHCCKIDSVYEASAYAAVISAVHKRGRADSDGEGSASDSASDSSEDDLGDEFDENNVSEAFKATLSEKQKARLAKQKAREEKAAEKAARRARKEAKRAKHSERGAERLVARASRFAWSAEEDAVLKREYLRYAGSRSLFRMIAENEDLKAFGMHRSEAQIAKRCKELQLHMQVEQSDDEADGEGSAGSEDELAILSPAVGAAAGADGVLGDKIFSDDEAPHDAGLDLSGADLFSPGPAPTKRSGRTQPGETETQVDTQYDSPSSSQRGARTQTQGSAFANVFSPSDTSLQDDIEQEGGRPSSPLATGAGATQSQRLPEAEVTQSQRAHAPNNTQAATGKRSRTAKKASTESWKSPTGRAAWDLDEGEVDILEQRALGLHKATGRATDALSDEDSAVGGAAQKKAKVARKGLAKRPRSKASKTGADSDEDAGLFGTAGAEVEATQSQHAEGTVGAELTQQEQRAATYKKRLMRIESDDEL